MYEDFQAMGIEIVGVGFDELTAISEWAEEEEFQYEIWRDSDKTLALYYGAATSTEQSLPARVTKLLDSEGKLVLEYNDASFLSNPANVLDDCKIIFGDSE